MQVKINLLPKPKSKGHDLVAVLVLFTLLLGLTGFYGVSYYVEASREMSELKREIEAKQVIKQNAFERMMAQQDISAENYVLYYTKLDSFIHSIYMEPTELIQSMKRELPIQAHITSLSLAKDGQLFLDCTFRTKGDAALFLHRLLLHPLVQEAELHSISTRGQEGSDIGYSANFTLTVLTLAGEQNE